MTEPALIDVTSRYPPAMSTITRFSPPSEYQCAAPPARLVIPDTTAANRSALARSRVADIAMSKPSEDTATASSTPAVPDVNESNSQLKVCASGLRFTVLVIVPLFTGDQRGRHAGPAGRPPRTARRGRAPRPDPAVAGAGWHCRAVPYRRPRRGWHPVPA